MTRNIEYDVIQAVIKLRHDCFLISIAEGAKNRRL